MNLAARAIKDFARFSSDGSGFGVTAFLTAPNGQTAAIKCFTTEHHYAVKFDDSGNEQAVNSQNTSIALSEMVVLAANPNYPVRDGNNEVNLNGHLFLLTFA